MPSAEWRGATSRELLEAKNDAAVGPNGPRAAVLGDETAVQPAMAGQEGLGGFF